MKSQYLLSLIWIGLLTACSSQPVKQSADVESVASTSIEDVTPALAQSTKLASVQAESRSTYRVKTSHQLGTKWGDEVSSYVKQVNLKRVSNRAVDETQVHYSGKQVSGKNVNSISLASGKISFAVLDDQGRNLGLYRDEKQYFLTGHNGQSYQLRYNNSSAQTFEVVASVDGLDVLDGQKASRQKSGYVLQPYSSLAIEGFRKSNSAVALFTFSSPDQSYAAHTAQGSIRNTGIIGTVIYELKVPLGFPSSKNGNYAPAPNAFPAD